ncbi:hypothetical protein AGMMS50255_5540 [Spirochaetia bacterium]|nr:hypothetical protein AGMMS50255_5540 [Spirochaetia bacterium]
MEAKTNQIDWVGIDVKFEYYKYFMEKINREIGFSDKIICEIGADGNLTCSNVALLCGAKKVFAISPWGGFKNNTNEKIIAIEKNFEETLLDNESVDVIFSIATLEHVINIADFAKNVLRIIRKEGRIYLQGCPMWTSNNGHHLNVRVNNTHYSFDTINYSASLHPIDDWYHLTYPNISEFERYMLSKNVPQEAISDIYYGIYTRPWLSRLTPTEIITAFHQYHGDYDYDLKTVRTNFSLDYPTNEYYEEAKKYYSEDDLKTCGLEIYIDKK